MESAFNTLKDQPEKGRKRERPSSKAKKVWHLAHQLYTLNHLSEKEQFKLIRGIFINAESLDQKLLSSADIEQYQQAYEFLKRLKRSSIANNRQLNGFYRDSLVLLGRLTGQNLLYS